MSRLPAIAIACALVVPLLAGCGEGGVEEGATLAVYVSAPLRGSEAAAGRRLCDEAREEAARGNRDAVLKLRVVCLDAAGPGGGWTLAQVGANARRATEDSTAVAYLGEPDRAARRQSGPILAAAEIAQLRGVGGHQAIVQVNEALAKGDEDEPRGTVFDALG